MKPNHIQLLRVVASTIITLLLRVVAIAIITLLLRVVASTIITLLLRVVASTIITFQFCYMKVFKTRLTWKGIMVTLYDWTERRTISTLCST